MKIVSHSSVKKVILSLVFGLFVFLQSFSQILEPVKWSFDQKKISNDIVELQFTANIDPGWHLYSQNIPENGPIPTTFTFAESKNYKLLKTVKEPKATEEYDPNFEMTLKYFSNKALFKQRIKILTESDFDLDGGVEFMCCNDKGCIPPELVDFSFAIKGAKKEVVKETIEPTTDNTETVAVVEDTAQKIESVDLVDTTAMAAIDQGTISNSEDPAEAGKTSSLWGFFIAAFLGGVIAVLTPCVYPMIPMTVSYFMHQSGDKKKSMTQATVFGVSIILIFLIIGTLVAVTLGEGFTNWLSTHWIPNIFFFLLFAIFAASFFGMFEITLPSWIVNKSDKQAERGGSLGAFFMAFTLVVVSFSCTAPIAGSILALSTQGEVIRPVIGMLGYSLAFAIPFTLFAMFPSALDKLPKSGGWLNAVKVVIGFIELALALKFLSVADQTYHWGILDREIYLSLWIVIFTLMGFYLIGKLRFSHDSPFTHLGVPRLILAIITFSFVVYMIPGLFGAPLKALSGWTPPMTTHDFDLKQIVRDNAGGGTLEVAELCEEPKHEHTLHLPHGLKGYFDIDQALACAKEQNKPIFVDFTGHGCVNCREMEANVWSDPAVLKMLREDYIVVAMYVDDKKIKLPEEEWYTSDYDGKVKKTLGAKNFDFQKSKFNANAQPYYVLMGLDGEKLVVPRAYDLDIDKFVDFLERGKESFDKKFPN